ncbi:MAG: hypothetical protein JO057_25295 [Chloroflexi bacterium]|nr:hypothetical protein [Chloroflexota bacterium]
MELAQCMRRGYSGEDTLQPISRDEFFDAFDRDKLDFLYQDEANSPFSKFVSREERR